MLRQTLALLALTIGLTANAQTSRSQDVYWKKQNVEMNVTSGGTQQFSFAGIFNRVAVSHYYYECGYYSDPQVEVRAGTCYETTCTGGAGRSDAWDAFYSARKEEKASKLAAAIKGVGKVSAEALVAGNYFSSKPRSWDAFKTQIKLASSQGAITKQVEAMVLSTYRADNMSNLGYASGSCRSTPYPCDEVVIIREGYYVSQTCDDAVENVIEQKAVNYTFNVRGAVLLSSEVEKLTAVLSGDARETQLSQSFYNSYNLQVVANNGNQVVVDIQGTGRKQVDLPQDSLQSVNLIPVNGNKAATLQVSVKPTALPARSTEKLVIDYLVRTCAVGAFGTCGLSWDKSESYTQTLTSAISNFQVPVNIRPGRKGIRMEIEVKIYKQNSIFHNAEPVKKTTDKLTLK